jgi:DNA-binding transcriptional LysR family regulator
MPHIVTRPIWPDPLEFMVHKGHEMCRRKSLDLKELSKFPAILPGLNTYTGQIVKSLFDRRGLPISIAIATNYLETIRMMASVGLGWTVLPRSMLDQSLATLPIRDTLITRTLGAVHHEGRSLSRAAQAFIKALESFRDTAPD